MMKKFILGAVLFLMVFAGTALAFNFILNRGYESRKVEASESELPVLSVACGDFRLNSLRGYMMEVNPVLERDAIIPVGNEKAFSVLVPQTVSDASLSYELRDVTGEILIENGDLERKEGEVYAEYPVELRMDLTAGREYMFQVKLDTDDGTIRYYTRVVRLEKNMLDRLLPYAENLSSEVLAKHLPTEGIPEKWEKSKEDAEKELAKKESSTSADGTEETEVKTARLGLVTKDSDAYDVLYGGLGLSLVSERTPELREVSETSAVIGYRFSVVAADGSYYTVRENMMLEYDNSTDRVVLKDYKREMDAILKSDCLDGYSNSVELGIASENPAWVISQDDTRLLFTANGTVWFYDYKNSLITELFGMGQGNLPSEAYRIVPLYVDERRADFMILGRIPEGKNEGKNGILLMSYTVEDASLSELLLLETSECAEALQNEVGRFYHYDPTEKTILLLINNKLTSLRLADGSAEILVEGIPSERYFVSDDRRLLIYPDSADPASVKKLTIRNMETGTVSEADGKGKILSPIGFIGDCFVYGASSENDVRRNADGSAAFYMSSLFIVGSDGAVIKEYHKAGKLVSGVEFVGSTIYLTLVEGSGGSYTDGGKDYISYKPEVKDDELMVTEGVRSGAYVCRLTFPDSIYLRGRPAEIMPTYHTGRKLVRVSEEYSGISDEIYLYDCTGLKRVLSSTGAAIRSVNEEGGYAVRGGQPLYFSREAASYYTVAGTFTYEKVTDVKDSYKACLVMALRSAGIKADMAELESDADWETAFRERSSTVSGLNFSGADLDTGVLFLGEGSPFATRIGDKYILVVSYNATHIRYYDPVQGEEVRVGRDDFEKDVMNSGNEFYTWRRGG